MSKKNDRAQNLAYDWKQWLMTRRYFGPPMPKHIIAVLSMPNTGGEEPDAPMSAEIAAFHLGVCSLDDKHGRPFIKVYCGFPKGLTKEQWLNEGISERAYYDRAHKGAEFALAEMNRAINRLKYGWEHPLLTLKQPLQQSVLQESGV